MKVYSPIDLFLEMQEVDLYRSSLKKDGCENMGTNLHKVNDLEYNHLPYRQALIDFMKENGYAEDVYVELAAGNPMKNQIGALYIEKPLLNDLKNFIDKMKEKREKTEDYYPNEKLEKLKEAHEEISKDLEKSEDNYIYYIVF